MRKTKQVITVKENASPEKLQMTPYSLLERYFKEANALGFVLTPDEAMRRLVTDVEESNICLALQIPAKVIWPKGTNSKEPQSSSLLQNVRKLHLLAVGLYYKARMPGPGRPRSISDERCSMLLDKRLMEGKTYLQIAKELSEPVRTPAERMTSKEKIRQQVRIAISRII
jgi:hypothetical protein